MCCKVKKTTSSIPVLQIKWKERFSIGAGLGANLLRLPILGIDQSLNVIMAGVRGAYMPPDSIWHVHAGVSGVVLWSESNTTPGWRIIT